MRRSFPGVSSVKRGVVYLAEKLKATTKDNKSPTSSPRYRFNNSAKRQSNVSTAERNPTRGEYDGPESTEGIGGHSQTGTGTSNSAFMSPYVSPYVEDAEQDEEGYSAYTFPASSQCMALMTSAVDAPIAR